MKKILPLSFLLLSATAAQAQWTITAADYPVIGNTQYYTLADTTGVTAGAPGTSITWDFSGIAPKTTHRTATYVTPSSLPSGSCCASATISYSDDASVFAHYKVSGTDSVELIGDRSLTGTPIVYTDAPKVRDFDMSHGDSYTNTLNSVYFDGVFSNATRTGTLTVTYESSGTLKTPFADYADVALIHSSWVCFDSSHSGLVDTDFWLDMYEFYQNGKPLPIFVIRNQIVIVNGASPQITKEVMYADSMVVGTESPVAQGSLMLFPNPASEQVHVAFDLQAPAAGVATVHDLAGREVMRTSLSALNAGRNAISLDVASLRAGAYLVTVQAADQVMRAKLIVD